MVSILTDAAEWRVLTMCKDDTAVACVAWWLDELLGILLVRSSDGALAVVEVPEEAYRDLRTFDRNAIVRSGVTLQAAVRWALPDADFRGR